MTPAEPSKEKKEMRSCPHCDDPAHALRYANEICMWKQIESLIQLVREMEDKLRKSTNELNRWRCDLGQKEKTIYMIDENHETLIKADSFLKEHGGEK